MSLNRGVLGREASALTVPDVIYLRVLSWKKGQWLGRVDDGFKSDCELAYFYSLT